MRGDYSDPKTRCRVCGKPRPPLAVKYADPYCSRKCLERDLGLPRQRAEMEYGLMKMLGGDRDG